MQDLIPHGRALLWILFIAFLAMATVPSVVMIDSLRQYARFLSAWEPGTLRQTRSYSIPHREDALSNARAEIHFIDFALRAPKAHKVTVAGDFSRWEPIALTAPRKSGGRWETQIPLPPGRYEYAFQVDGTWTPDPSAQASGEWGEKTTSILEVR